MIPSLLRTSTAVLMLSSMLLAQGQAARADPYLQLELGVLPKTAIDARAGEHVEVDTEPGPTGAVVAGWDFAPWRVQLALGYRYINTDGLLHASFQTNGSLTLWSGLIELLCDVDLAPATGLPLAAFAGLRLGF